MLNILNYPRFLSKIIKTNSPLMCPLCFFVIFAVLGFLCHHCSSLHKTYEVAVDWTLDLNGDLISQTWKIKTTEEGWSGQPKYCFKYITLCQPCSRLLIVSSLSKFFNFQLIFSQLIYEIFVTPDHEVLKLGRVTKVNVYFLDPLTTTVPT